VLALFTATGGAPPKQSPVALEQVSPLLLMQPVRDGEVLDLYAGGDFDLVGRCRLKPRINAPRVAVHLYTRGGVFLHLSHGGQGETLLPPYTG
jgi:5'-3' exoribonuclease 1